MAYWLHQNCYLLDYSIDCARPYSHTTDAVSIDNKLFKLRHCSFGIPTSPTFKSVPCIFQLAPKLPKIVFILQLEENWPAFHSFLKLRKNFVVAVEVSWDFGTSCLTCSLLETRKNSVAWGCKSYRLFGILRFGSSKYCGFRVLFHLQL